MIPSEKTKVSSLTGDMGKKIDEWAVWYSGDPNRISDFYANWIAERVPNGRFWAQLDKQERLSMVHEPLAADICQVSANLLFSEPADIQYEDKGRSGDRITEFIKQNGMYSKMLEGAELAAAMGGVYLKIDTDPSVSSVPMVSIRTPEMAIPSFVGDRLQSVTFWSIVGASDSYDEIYRLFEHRVNQSGTLIVQYALFKGNRDTVGQKVPLEQFEETAGYKDVMYSNFQGLGCVYVPNVKPNRLFPGSAQGMGDYSDCISMLDSLDETMTSWMRDLTLGQARLFADAELFDVNRPTDPNFPSVSGTETTSRFDPYQRVYQKIDLSGWRLEGSQAKPIDQVQFDIRVDEHARTAAELIEKIVSRSGYAPQSFGLNIEGRADSGTALRLRERKSLLTQNKKAKYWAPAMRGLFTQLQLMDQRTGLSGSYEAQDVDVVPADSITNDLSDIAQTVKDLRAADAISTYMSVKMSHPDWDEERIKQEVDRIQQEKGMPEVPPEALGG